MENPSSYKERIKRHSPPSPYLKNSLFAFISGGTVCLFGEVLANLFIKLGIKSEDSYLLVTVSLIFIASLLTGLGVFDKIALGCSDEVAKNLHCHFSKIEYTSAGEKKHLTFEDTVYGPDFAPLAEVLVKRKAEPIIICESAGAQSKDALEMQALYAKAAK